MPWGNGIMCRAVLMSWEMKEVHVTAERVYRTGTSLNQLTLLRKRRSKTMHLDPSFSSASGKATFFFKTAYPVKYSSLCQCDWEFDWREEEKKKKKNQTPQKTQPEETKCHFGQNCSILPDPGFLYKPWESQAGSKAQPLHLSPNTLQCL